MSIETSIQGEPDDIYALAMNDHQWEPETTQGNCLSLDCVLSDWVSR